MDATEHATDIVHYSTDHISDGAQVEPVLSGTTSRPQQVTEVVTDEQNATDNQHPPEQVMIDHSCFHIWLTLFS